MILRRRVALDGVQLDQVDSRILIQSIETAAGKETISAQSMYSGDGSRVTNEHRDSLDIVVKFTINEKSYNPEARATVLENVNRWACLGGWLTVNFKPGRKIRVIAAQLPGEGDAGARTPYAITFRAYGVPYWQQESPALVRHTGVSSCSGVLGVPGSAKTVCDVSFKNTSGGTVNTLNISVGGSSFQLTGLGLGNNGTLVIEHEDDGKRAYLRIRIGSTSKLGCRAGSDDLYVEPGSRSYSMSAGGSGTFTISCAGRYA